MFRFGEIQFAVTDFARIYFCELSVLRDPNFDKLKTSSRGPAHGITTLANEASDVMGSSWRRPTVYLQRSLKLLTSCHPWYVFESPLNCNVYHVGKFTLSARVASDLVRPLRFIKACTSSSPYRISLRSLRNHISVCVKHLKRCKTSTAGFFM